ncbi:hypothetical protein R3P38DRAFT_3152107 [Favolaschia claudopus]|uniref:DUF6535 domain-containing protein n=1 Tax=Favolaschia claudopus TaxID=2862362 RepID=A0AAV9Z0X0_9AGAR
MAALIRIPEKMLDELPAFETNDEHPDARWTEIHSVVLREDRDMIKDYDAELNMYLVFAGLFSGLTTALIVDIRHNLLDVNYGQDSSLVLRSILDHLRLHWHIKIDSGILPWPGPSDAWAMYLQVAASGALVTCFMSLGLSLTAATLCISVKQGLHDYARWIEIGRTSRYEALILRRFYQAKFDSSQFPKIFRNRTIALLLELAVAVFWLGMFMYLWGLDVIVLWLLVVLYGAALFRMSLTIKHLSFGPPPPPHNWKETDIRIAKERLMKEPATVDLGISHIAILLNIRLGDLNAVMSNHAPSLASNAGANSIQDLIRNRVHELSADATALLCSIVTSPKILQASLNKDDAAKLLRLWELSLLPITHTPLNILCSIHYLEDCIKKSMSVNGPREDNHVKLLVQLLPLTHRLSEEQVSPDALAAELCRIAVVVHDWAGDAQDESTIQLTLEALTHAGMCVPLKAEPLSGISPVTPYLALLHAFERTIRTVQQIRHGPQNYSASPVWLSETFRDADTLYGKLRDYHSSFLCTRRRGFKSPNTDEPRRVRFSADSVKVFVGTDEVSAWVLGPADESSAVVSLAVAELKNEIPGVSGVLIHRKISNERKIVIYQKFS